MSNLEDQIKKAKTVFQIHEESVIMGVMSLKMPLGNVPVDEVDKLKANLSNVMSMGVVDILRYQIVIMEELQKISEKVNHLCEIDNVKGQGL